MGPAARRWRRAESARRLQARHEGSAPAHAPGGSESIETLPPAHGRVMELPPIRATGAPASAPEDFAALLRDRGLYPQVPVSTGFPSAPGLHTPTQATTILAFKFADGV